MRAILFLPALAGIYAHSSCVFQSRSLGYRSTAGALSFHACQGSLNPCPPSCLQRIPHSRGRRRGLVQGHRRGARRECVTAAVFHRWTRLTSLARRTRRVDHHPDDLCWRCEECVRRLSLAKPSLTTQSAGADDLALVERLSNGKVGLTFGSALDIFGGTQVKFDELVEYNRRALRK